MNCDKQQDQAFVRTVRVTSTIFVVVVGITGLGLWGCPQYNVYKQTMAASAIAEAEVIRAGGVAKANAVIADGLGGPEGYLRYLYIDMLRETGSAGRETIYIATEAAMPILEATRLGNDFIVPQAD